MRLIATLALSSLAPSALAQSQHHLYSFEGPGFSSAWQLGRSVSALGDLDGDARPDFALGLPGAKIQSSSVGAVRVISGTGGLQLYERFGELSGDAYGHALAGPGDVDGDGVRDVLVGAPHFAGGGAFEGTVDLLDADGNRIAQLSGELGGDAFGASVGSIGDVDGDGLCEFLVGAQQDPANGPGYARVYSAPGGVLDVLTEVGGSGPGDSFGIAAQGLGDVDLDGTPDFGVGATQSTSGLGYVRVVSGANGALLYTLTGQGSGDHFGRALDGVGDVDFDGDADFVVGAPENLSFGVDEGYARLFSGSDGQLLLHVEGDDPNDHFGEAVAGLGDVNQDGVPDWAVGSRISSSLNQPGYVRVFGGTAGLELLTLVDPQSSENFGSALAGPGDLNGDGLDDLLVGASGHDTPTVNAGRASAYSVLPLLLATDTHTHSLSAGGFQELSLDAGPAHAGSLYFVLGSASGIAPGIALGGQVLPLNLDAYLLLTANSPSAAPLNSPVGFLSGAGTKTAFFSLGAGGPTSLSGLTAHHAYLLLDGGGNVSLTSNAVPISFTP